MGREYWPFDFKTSACYLEANEAAKLARRAAEMCDRLYALGKPKSLSAAEKLDSLLEEFIEEVSDRLEYVDVESWNMSGSCNPEEETGIEDYEIDECAEDLPPVVGDYWEPHMLTACDDGSYHGLAA
jgi:hypothetical protein